MHRKFRWLVVGFLIAAVGAGYLLGAGSAVRAEDANAATSQPATTQPTAPPTHPYVFKSASTPPVTSQPATTTYARNWDTVAIKCTACHGDSAEPMLVR